MKIEKKLDRVYEKSIKECREKISKSRGEKELEIDVDKLLVHYKNSMIDTIVDTIDKLKNGDNISSAFDELIKIGIEVKSYRDFLYTCVNEIKKSGEIVEDYIQPKEVLDKKRKK